MKRQEVIAKAGSQNNIKENPAGSNRNPYGEWYGMNGVPWCAIFVSWVFDKAGIPLGQIDSPKGYHYCPSAYNFWKRTKRITNQPAPGDIVLFDWNGDGTSDHTGIFVEWVEEGKVFTSWEGNTSVSSDSDGGQVMLRRRAVSTVKAFVNPSVYDEQVVSAPLEWRIGSTGADVTRIQKLLYDLKYTITVDGDFGEKTEAVVKQFQKDNGLVLTGIVNDVVEGAMEAALRKPKVPEKKTVTGAYLKKGDAGAAVVALQKAINKTGIKTKLEEDGVFGQATVDALKAFQKKNKLTVDGIAGPQTFKTLNIKNI